MWKPGSQGGRPPVGPKVETRLPEEVLNRVDDFAEQYGLARAEALRQLVNDGLLLAPAREKIRSGTIKAKKIEPGAIQDGKVDPNDPLFVQTLIRWALKKVGMNEDEATQYAEAHQQNAVDAYRRTTEQ